MATSADFLVAMDKREAEREAWDAVTHICEFHYGPNDDNLCHGCGGPLTGKQTRWCPGCSDLYAQNHLWNVARPTRRLRDGSQCVKCGSRDRLEVHHIISCKGQHAIPGCHHHQSNLVTLCHSCHVQVTSEPYHLQQLSA